jgi:hypothetical protein
MSKDDKSKQQLKEFCKINGCQVSNYILMKGLEEEKLG